MEPDRYQKNHVAFIVGLISLILCIMVLAFGLFILPNLLFHWQYDTPAFLIYWQEWLRAEYQIEATLSARLILFFFFGLALIFGLITYFLSNHIDDEIFSAEVKRNKAEKIKNTEEGFSILFKIILGVIIVLLGAYLMQWLINM